MKPFFTSLTTALLVLLFVYAATSKLITFSDFHRQLYRQPFSHRLADVLLFALPVSEIATAILLVVRRTQLAGLFSSALLLFVFTGYISLGLLHFWAHIPCSCGGILNHMSWHVHLVFNCTFLLVNLIAILIYDKERRAATLNNL